MDIAFVLAGLAGLIVGVGLGYAIFKDLAARRGVKEAQETARQEMEKVRIGEWDRLHSVYDLISTLTSTLIYNRVLELALDLATSVLTSPNKPGNRITSAALLFAPKGSETNLQVGLARGLTQTDLRTTLPGREGVIAQVIESGEPALCKDITQDPELSQFVALQSCRIAYCLPLRTGLDTYGVLLFAHPDPDFFTTSQRDLLDIMAHQAVIALQNARLYQDLEQEKERMLEIQEEARKKLARDLHDGPIQSVAAIAMRINFTRRLIEKDPKASTRELVKIEDLARRTTQEIRHMLFTLRPLVLESQGLTAALQSMAEKMRDTFEQTMVVEVDPKVVADMEIGKQTIIFYIVEEAVTNARKYAQAGHIWVRLKSVTSDLALLEVQDDGVGFDLETVNDVYETRGSLGMVNMRERTAMINGVLRIDSTPGQGATIHVVIPLTEDAAERLRQGV